MSLQPSTTTVGKLQETLRAKAKSAPTYRFYLLYDKVYRRDVLAEAYARCRANHGKPGVDGQSFEDIEKDFGLASWLAELSEELRTKTYKPKPVRRVWIPKLKLTVNETKTRLCRSPEETFDFLGYTIGTCYSPKTGKAFTGTYPAAKKVKKLIAEISRRTERKSTWREPAELVAKLNCQIRGWANYFCLGPVSKSYDRVSRHARQRLRRWLCRKYRVAGSGGDRFTDKQLHEELGLIDLRTHRRGYLSANA